MRLSEDIVGFVTSPVMIVLGSRDAANRPAIGRGLGIAARGDDLLDIVFCRWQWPRTAGDIDATGTLALTCARPSDYVSYQLKGDASLRAADAADRDLARAYRQDIAEVLIGLGVAPHMIAQWSSDRDLAVARLRVGTGYIQTPGTRAGTGL